MADVVVDEWLLIRGLEAEQPAAGLERESADLLALVQTWHRWVMTDDIVDIYQRRIYHCLLVTGDRRLLAQLDRCGLPAQHHFTASFVTDALTLLDPQQPALT